MKLEFKRSSTKAYSFKQNHTYPAQNWKSSDIVLRLAKKVQYIFPAGEASIHVPHKPSTILNLT